MMNIVTTNRVEEAADFIISSILNQLNMRKKVLFFICGGSAIDVAVKVSEFLRNYPCEKLTITLTDERYGAVGHADSNYFQLKQKGFSLSNAKFIPVLCEESRDITVEKFNKIIGSELQAAEYKIGLFGIGKDGHTAGVLPLSEAINSEDLVYGYDTATFYRITITSKTIEKLDEAVVWAQGEDKWGVLGKLNENVSIKEQPSQILKKVPLLTIFTDFKKI